MLRKPGALPCFSLRVPQAYGEYSLHKAWLSAKQGSMGEVLSEQLRQKRLKEFRRESSED